MATPLKNVIERSKKVIAVKIVDRIVHFHDKVRAIQMTKSLFPQKIICIASVSVVLVEEHEPGVELPVEALTIIVVAPGRVTECPLSDRLLQFLIVLVKLLPLHRHGLCLGQGELQDGLCHIVGGALRHQHPVVDCVGAEHDEEVGKLGNTDSLERLGGGVNSLK